MTPIVQPAKRPRLILPEYEPEEEEIVEEPQHKMPSLTFWEAMEIVAMIIGSGILLILTVTAISELQAFFNQP